MEPQDEFSIKQIETLYNKADQSSIGENVLPFPGTLSPTGESILDDLNHLLRRNDYRDAIEERLLCALQDVAKIMMNNEGT
jgi:hypothetical protein